MGKHRRPTSSFSLGVPPYIEALIPPILFWGAVGLVIFVLSGSSRKKAPSPAPPPPPTPEHLEALRRAARAAETRAAAASPVNPRRTASANASQQPANPPPSPRGGRRIGAPSAPTAAAPPRPLNPREAAAQAALERRSSRRPPAPPTTSPPRGRPATPDPSGPPPPSWEVSGYVPGAGTLVNRSRQSEGFRAEPLIVSVDSVIEVQTLDGAWVPLQAVLDTGNEGHSVMPLSVARRLGLVEPGPIGSSSMPVLKHEAVKPEHRARGPFRPGGMFTRARGVVAHAYEDCPVAWLRLRAPAGASELARVERFEEVSVTMNEELGCEVLVSRRFIEAMEEHGWTVRASGSR